MSQHTLWHCVGTQQEIIVAGNRQYEYLTLVLEYMMLKLRFVYIDSYTGGIHRVSFLK